MNKLMKRTLEKAFENTEYSLEFDDDTLIVTLGECSCEFVACAVTRDGGYLTATFYPLDDDDLEVQCHIPNDLPEFIDVVEKILTQN